MNFFPHIEDEDPEIFAVLEGEELRQEEGLELIPSENYVSRAVKEAMASSFTNKYAEGYPGKRYYGGQEFTDKVETLAIDRAKELFGAAYANVQPLGGANANIAMYFALLQPGDTVLGMDLSHGGHLTHGHPVTYLTKVFNFIRYKMKDIETGEIDYDDMRRIAKEVKPKIVLAGFSAYPRELEYAKFIDIAREVGAIAVMDIAHIAGLIAGKAAKNELHVVFETHVKHAIGFIEYNGSNLVHVEKMFFVEIDQAAGSCDNDFNSVTQSCFLFFVSRAAVNRDSLEICSRNQRHRIFIDLICKFTSGN